jgi:predicted PurR-regulated permease PerM
MLATRKQLWIDFGCLAGLLGAVGLLCYALGGVLAPFAASAFAAYLLLPVVEFLERRGLSRQAAVNTLYGGSILVAVSAALLLIPQFMSQVETLHGKLPEYSSLAQEKLLLAQRDLEARIPEMAQYRVAETITGQAATYIEESMHSLPRLLLNAFTLISILVIVPFMTWYLLIEGATIKKSLISLVPNRYFETVLNLIHRVDANLSAYLFGQLTDALVVGLLSAIGYSLIGVHYGIVIGMASGFVNLIPYVGPVAGALIAILVTVLEIGFTVKILFILLVAAAVQVGDNFFIQPTVMSKSVALHPFAVLAILLIAGDVWGLWGMLLGIPVFCVCKIVVEELVGVIRRQSVDVI